MARLQAIDLGWDREISYCHGAPERLAGIDVYYDFPWFSQFGDRRVQFRNGLCLAKLVRKRCPAGKRPSLLLTDRDEVPQGPRDKDEHFVWVLNLPRYRKIHADAALTYVAGFFSSDISRLAELNDLANAHPDELRAFLDMQLTPAHVARWIAAHPEHAAELQQITGPTNANTLQPTSADIVSALTGLDALDAEIVSSLAGALRVDMSPESRLQLLRAMTDDATGRELTVQLLGERITDRIADVRRDIDEYSALLANVSKGETHLQEFLEEHPWLLGLEYVQVRPQRTLPRGTMDFILERYDGGHDLLELKTPQDQIIVAPDAVDGVPPPAHKFSLSDDLAQALAQIHVYRDTLNTEPSTLEKLYGLRNTRNVRGLVVIGRAASLPPHRLQVLRDFNLSLHGVEIVPYDTLAERATAVLNNVEQLLSASTMGSSPLAEQFPEP